MSELPACPICNSLCVLRQNYTIGANVPGYIVKCTMCGLSSPQFMSEEMAVHYWQHRSAEDALRARIAELEAQLAAARDAVAGLVRLADEYYAFGLDGFEQDYEYAYQMLHKKDNPSS